MAKKANTTRRAGGGKSGARRGTAGGTSRAGGAKAKRAGTAARGTAAKGTRRGAAKSSTKGMNKTTQGTRGKAKGAAGKKKRTTTTTTSRRTTRPRAGMTPRGSTSTRGGTGGRRSGAGETTRTRATAGSDTSTSRRGGGGGGRAKVGSDEAALQRTGGAGDFGIPAAKQTRPQPIGGREKGPQKGTGPMRAGTMGDRVSGVGGDPGGPGHSSGGDLDPDYVGIAGSGGLSESAPGNVNPGQAATTGGSEEFASGGPAQGRNQDRARGRVGGRKQVEGGSTVDRSGGDASTTGPETSIGAASPNADIADASREPYTAADIPGESDMGGAPKRPDHSEGGEAEPPALEE